MAGGGVFKELASGAVHVDLPPMSAARFLSITSQKCSFFGGNEVQRDLFRALVDELVSEEPVKLSYLSRRFEHIHRQFLSTNSNQTFLVGGLKELLLVDVNDVLFGSDTRATVDFISANPAILGILGLTIGNVEVMLKSYSTQFKVSAGFVESQKFRVALPSSRVLPTSDRFEEFMSSLQTTDSSPLSHAPESDFCATPKYQLYLGN